MYAMFNACINLTQLDVSNFNTSQVTNMRSMFHNCINLTQLDVSNFNTSQVTYMDAMFHSCTNLTQLDVSNFDTSQVTYMYGMFSACNKLTQLDLSNFNTSNVDNMQSMFNGCNNLTQLDVSNFNTSNVTNMENMFYNTSKLVNIGMLYCSPSTINTISSNLSNTLQKNIWIQNVKPSELPSYDYISYKKYKEEKELNLNSPLLEGDKIVKKDGKLYHYHKMGKVVFDGREGWWDRSSYYISDTQTRFSTSINAKPCASGVITLICDKYPVLKAVDGVAVKVGLGINLHVEGKTIYITVPKTTLEEFKTHLQANPTTVVYELANPYYEEISNDTLYLSIDKLSDYKMVVNNSTIPTKNMVQNRTFSTITLKPNTIYTVKFDRIGTDELTIDLGGTIATCVGNKVEIMTSNEITRDDIVFYGDDEISNVMVIESSFDENNIPKENFEGLKSSFEDGYIPSEEDNIAKNDEYYLASFEIIYNLENLMENINIKPSTTYTIRIKDDTNKIIRFQISSGSGQNLWVKNENLICKFTTPNSYSGTTRIYFYASSDNQFTNDDLNKIYVQIFEGDWTHLTEEDFNNLGKYKVEYKTINCPIEFGKGGRIK
jgi:surface protein